MKKLHINEWSSHRAHEEPSSCRLNLITWYTGSNDYGFYEKNFEGNSHILDLTDSLDKYEEKITKELKSGKYPGLWIHTIELSGYIRYGAQWDADDYEEDEFYGTPDQLSFVVSDVSEIDEYFPDTDWHSEDFMEDFYVCQDYFKKYGKGKDVYKA